jgi:Leucine-rich repeat (LRR) protein
MHHAYNKSYKLEAHFDVIAEKIAKKLKGDPKSAEMLGAQLRNKFDIACWEKISEQDWSGHNMKSRIWCYHNLNADLQRCFAFCSLFPKGFRFSGPMLIYLWMAEGFIKPADDGTKMEDIGKRYLKELVCCYFLEKREDKNEREYYVLHDLLHDLAEYVCGHDCIRLDIPSEKGKLSENENIHHLSLCTSMINEVKDDICRQKNLRTLICFEEGGTILKNELEKILQKCKKLRVLSLPSCGIEDLPSSVSNLKHLRYMDISGSSLLELPNSICKLYHLQVLALTSCESIPKDFSNLVSLRVFETNEETISKISHVGLLTSLQRLSKFHVMNRDGHELRQLENLTEVQGLLHISGLENVTNVEDAVKAKIRDKKFLGCVVFEWNGDIRATDDTAILEALQPHPYVRSLAIRTFKGRRLPNWLLNQKSRQHLDLLQLDCCTEVEDLSSILQSLPNCSSLMLGGFDSLREFPSLPPKLNKAYIDLPPLLTCVAADDLNSNEERKRSTLKIAQKIAEIAKHSSSQLPFYFSFHIIEYLQKVKRRIKAAPEIPNRSLKWQEFLLRVESIASRDELFDLWIMCMDCELQTMFDRGDEVRLDLPSSLTILIIECGSITNQALSMCIQNLVLLTKLHLRKILTITSLPPKEVLSVLNHLQSMKLEDCYLLTSLGGIQALTDLRKLKLYGCPILNGSDVLLPSTLEKIDVRKSADVDVIIEKSNIPYVHCLTIFGCLMKKICLIHLSSLKKLGIGDCPNLCSLKGLSSLSELDDLGVWDCPHVDACVEKYPYPLHNASFDDPSVLKRILADESISSLKSLQFFCKADSIDDGVFRNLTSLTDLTFQNCQITSLPSNLRVLSALRYLEISNCQDLCRLTELPESLKEVRIEDCPNLKKMCQRDGPDWDKIANIPRKIIIWLVKSNSIIHLNFLFSDYSCIH